MKTVAVIIILFVGMIYADDSPVIEMSSGWSWYPYNTYYYPYSHSYYIPWYYRTGRFSPLSPYRYPEDTGWYGYNGYPYYCPFGGFYFHNSSVVIDLDSKKILKLPEVDLHPPFPGSAPLSLRSTNEISIQNERLKRFFRPNTPYETTKQ